MAGPDAPCGNGPRHNTVAPVNQPIKGRSADGVTAAYRAREGTKPCQVIFPKAFCMVELGGLEPPDPLRANRRIDLQ
jgi:hypothetical protein